MSGGSSSLEAANAVISAMTVGGSLAVDSDAADPAGWAGLGIVGADGTSCSRASWEVLGRLSVDAAAVGPVASAPVPLPLGLRRGERSVFAPCLPSPA